MWMWTAFTLGLFGSLHCLGMCGPIAMTLPLTAREKQSVVLQSLMYNLGRVGSYTLLGLAMGLMGWGILIAGYQKSISIILGVVLVLSAFFTVSLENGLLRIPALRHWYNTVKNKLSSLLNSKANGSAFQVGLANGLLPCGMVYIALAGALTSGGTMQGTFYMTLFGLGTLPMMMGVMLVSRFNRQFFLKLRKFIPLVMLIFGLLLIKRGLALELPVDFRFWEANNFPIMCH